MQKWYIKGTHLQVSTNYSTVVIKIYYVLIKLEKIVNHKNFVLFSFL